MSQEFLIDGDHEEMVANWIAESEECFECGGEGCEECDGLGRIAHCDLAARESAINHERIFLQEFTKGFAALPRSRGGRRGK